MVRRVMASAVLSLFVVAVVAGFSAVFGGGDDGTTQVAAGSDSTAAGGVMREPDPVSSTTAAAEAEPTTSRSGADHGRTPTKTDKLKLFLVGDSQAGGLSPVLTKRVEATGLVDAFTLYKVSSGFVRPDFYDWPKVLREQIPLHKPDIVVAVFGGNDGQAMNIGGKMYGVASPEYRAEYAKRVGEAMDILRSDGAKLIWVGLPNAESPDFRKRLEVINSVYEAEVQKRPGAVYVDAWSVFTGRNGGFAAYVVDPRDGELKDVRAKDQFHLNKTGEEILAVYVGDAVLQELRNRGADV